MAKAVSVERLGRKWTINRPEHTGTDAICSGSTTEGCRGCFGYHLWGLPDKPVDVFDTKGHVSFSDEGMNGVHAQREGPVSNLHSYS